jgi:hypothetical protein
MSPRYLPNLFELPQDRLKPFNVVSFGFDRERNLRRMSSGTAAEVQPVHLQRAPAHCGHETLKSEHLAGQLDFDSHEHL